MGCEVLETGVMLVERQDAKELLAIKQGKWLLGSVQAETAHLKRRLNRALLLSRLPEEPDMVQGERLLCDTLSLYLETEIDKERRHNE